MSLNSNNENSDHLSTLQEQNGEEYVAEEDVAEEVEDSERKERFRKVILSCVLPRRGFSLSESTSSDSITGKSMSVTIFDLTLNEKMNGSACWMKHASNKHKRYKLSSNIPPTFIEHIG